VLAREIDLATARHVLRWPWTAPIVAIAAAAGHGADQIAARVAARGDEIGPRLVLETRAMWRCVTVRHCGIGTACIHLSPSEHECGRIWIQSPPPEAEQLQALSVVSALRVPGEKQLEIDAGWSVNASRNSKT